MERKKIKEIKIAAIIPARGGSKRLPRKNILPLAEKPLIAYTIEAALKSHYLERVIVFSEDEEIIKVSRRCGAEVLKEPKNLAGDRIRMFKVVLKAIELLKKQNYSPDIIVLLLATVPFKTTEDINKAIALFLNKKADAVLSVCQRDNRFYYSLKLENGYLKPNFNRKHFLTLSQNLPKAYSHNGAICVISPRALKKYKTFYPPKIIPYLMPKEKSMDIDTKEDFLSAEKHLRGKQ